MDLKAKNLALTALFVLCGRSAFAQSVSTEPAAVIELGPGASWGVKGGGAGFGPSVAIEVTPIENWLEIEAGTTALFRRRGTEWDTDLLFKKPWTLSRKAEFMIGAGPEWIHTTETGTPRNSLAGEAVLDLMFWPSPRHKLGWYVEPGYEYGFAKGHEQSIGITGGLLIAIP